MNPDKVRDLHIADRGAGRSASSFWLIALVVIVFLGFWMFTDPAGLADTSKSAASSGWDLTTQAFNGVIDFVGAMD